EGVISGRVVADDGQPMEGAQVIAVGVGKSALTIAPQMTNCGADGNFKVTGLSHGVYSLLARAPGYVSVQDQSAKYRIGESAIIRLTRGGVITGRVTDEFGEPMVGVRVSADRVRDPEGKPDRSASAMNEMTSSRMTDDRGVYRIYGLEAGAYVVGVNAVSPMFGGLGQTGREPPTYHPSSPRGAAVEVNLRGAEEVSGVDIRSRGGRGRSISGTVSGETQGEGLISGVIVTLYGAADKNLAGMATLMGSQNFSLRAVEDGEYELSAMRFSASMDFALSAPRHVVVRGADLNGIELKLLKLGSVSGRVVIEGPKAQCKTADQFKVEEALIEMKRDDKTPGAFTSGLFPMESGMSLGGATPEKDGGFTVKNLEAGRYRIGADLPDENWYVRAITKAGTPKPIDVSLAGVTLKQGEKISEIEMTIAQGAASLSGRVVQTREGAQLPKRLRVHLIPAETTAADDLLRYAESPVRGDGSFEFKHIAPGKYLLSARQASEKEANDDQARQLAWDAVERAKLRREAATAKNEIELKDCQRVKEHVLRW
ncbi:MAG TPA: carboxypeptidase-like regulatory domain-containing protein, partial [Blastocatellia bacterium]|nr:carboxypeptidase-like regulatory domain-containing protein [Blastocatellia bacterium]